MTKNAKASFWSLKKYKIIYTKSHSAQQNELYALIQVIHLHPYPIKIISDSSYSVFVLKKIKTSTINSNQSISQQLFLELQSIIKDQPSPISHTETTNKKNLKSRDTQEQFYLFCPEQTSLDSKHKIFFNPITIVNTAFICFKFLKTYHKELS